MANMEEKTLKENTKELGKNLENISIKANPLDLSVSTTFAEEDIRMRYDRICRMIEQWRKRVQTEKSYEQGYEFGLVAAEKCFRNLFKDGMGNELESKSSD